MNLITVDWHDRMKFWDWCIALGCDPEPQYQGVWHGNDRWHIPNDDVYALALLRWS